MRKVMFAGLISMSLIAPAFADCYSTGVRVGTVQKISKKGIFSKSWEGELVMEGLKVNTTQHGTTSGNVWAFSVLDPKVAANIEQATMTGQSIALRYCQVPLSIGKTDTDYHITQAVIRSK